MKKAIFLEIICCLLIGLFLYASVSKWANFRIFRGDMLKQPFYGWIKWGLIWLLPPVEVLIALGLAMERTRRLSLYASAAIMGVFMVYTLAAVMRWFDKVPCGCGGIIRELSWNQHLVFNLFFTGMSIAGIILHHRVGKQAAVVRAGTA